jgi:hypothetical protein
VSGTEDRGQMTDVRNQKLEAGRPGSWEARKLEGYKYLWDTDIHRFKKNLNALIKSVKI